MNFGNSMASWTEEMLRYNFGQFRLFHFFFLALLFFGFWTFGLHGSRVLPPLPPFSCEAGTLAETAFQYCRGNCGACCNINLISAITRCPSRTARRCGGGYCPALIGAFLMRSFFCFRCCPWSRCERGMCMFNGC